MSSIRFSIDLGISNSTGFVRINVFFFFPVFLKGLRVGLMIDVDCGFRIFSDMYGLCVADSYRV